MLKLFLYLFQFSLGDFSGIFDPQATKEHICKYNFTKMYYFVT